MQNTQRVWKLKRKNETTHDKTDNDEGEEGENDYKTLLIWPRVLNKNYSVTILYEMRVSLIIYFLYLANERSICCANYKTAVSKATADIHLVTRDVHVGGRSLFN